MIVVLAAGLLLITVVLLALRPLLQPRPRAVAGSDTPADAAALELAVAERRARMAEREEARP
jgi:hypothetical protein